MRQGCLELSDGDLMNALCGDQVVRLQLIESKSDELILIARHDLRLSDETQIADALEYVRTQALVQFDRFIGRGLAYFHLWLHRMFLFRLSFKHNVALGHLLQTYRPDLERLTNRKELHHPVSPRGGETVASKAITKAFLRFSTFEGADLGAFWNWLETITLREGLGEVNGRKNSSLDEADHQSAREIQEHRSGPVSHVLNREQRERDEAQVSAAFQRLPPEFREVLFLRIWKDMSHPEIARKLGISEELARVRYHRAKEEFYQLVSANEEFCPD
jgi:RNA polymerase sigma factor (sigma-70 family)